MLPGMTRPVHDDDYYESLHTGEALQLPEPLHATVVCTYQHVDRVEDGYAGFDIKPGLLRSKSAKTGKKGQKYIAVPFRHMTPQKGTSANRAHGAVMPPDVYKIVRKSGAFQDPGDPGMGEQLGQRSKLAAVVNLQALARDEEAPMATNYTWKYGLYHGMRQIKKQYGKTEQSTYWTWRTVSERSDPSSWIHPGQAANPVIAAVIRATEADVQRIVLAAARAAWGVE
jgi:hypothetical protein